MQIDDTLLASIVEALRALKHNARLYADDVPHIDQAALKRELRRDVKQARKVLAQLRDGGQPRQ